MRSFTTIINLSANDILGILVWLGKSYTIAPVLILPVDSMQNLKV